MKTFFRIVGIIAFAVIIGFAFVTCGDGDDTGGGNGGGGGHTHNWGWATYTSGSGLMKCQIDGCTVKAGVGDTGPAGGIIIYANTTAITAYSANYLEAAPSNHGTLIRWCNCTSANCNVTTGTAIGTGKTNTAAIIAHSAHSGNTESNNAAKAVEAFRNDTAKNGGKNDWFLPSKDELNEMYKARSHLGILSGGFWSSSQYNDSTYNTNAYSQQFNYGNSETRFKDGTLNIRAVRAF